MIRDDQVRFKKKKINKNDFECIMSHTGTSGGSRHSARAGNAPGAGGAGAGNAPAAGKKTGAGGGKDKSIDEKSTSKQQSAAAAPSTAMTDVPGTFFSQKQIFGQSKCVEFRRSNIRLVNTRIIFK